MPPYPHPPDNEIITRQFKLLNRLIIILSQLPVKKVIVTTGLIMPGSPVEMST